MKKLTACILSTLLITLCFAMFGGCTKKDVLDYATTDESCSVISGTAFKEKELVIPSSHDGKPVTGVLEYAFVRNYYITKATLPEGTTYIGAGAFYNCTQLTTVKLPVSLTHIGYNAFTQCKKLEIINYGGTKAQWYSIEKEYLWDDYSGEYTIVCTDGTITKALNGNDLGTAGLIYEIYLKSWHCELINGLNAKAEDIEVSAKYYNFDVTAIGEMAFYGTQINSVKIPEGIMIIEDEAFKECSLKTVYLPSSISNIGAEAFGGCTSLHIHYADTRAKWEEISKDITWNNDCSYTVHCTDDNE